MIFAWIRIPVFQPLRENSHIHLLIDQIKCIYFGKLTRDVFSFIYYCKCCEISKIVFKFGKASEKFLKYMSKI